MSAKGSNRKYSWLVVLCAAMLASACESYHPPPFLGFPAVSPLEMEAGAKTFAPPPGRANLYIVRVPDVIPREGSGGALLVPMAVDGKVVGSLPLGANSLNTFFLITVDPGRHAIMALQAGHYVKLNTKADRNYFVEVFYNYSRSREGFGLSQMDEGCGRQLVMQGLRIKTLQE